MGIKYYCEYKSINNDQHRLNISKEDFNGTPIKIRGAKSPVTINFVPVNTDDVFSIIRTNLSCSFILQENSSIDIEELQLAQDREFIVEHFVNNELNWYGFLITDRIIRPLMSYPYTFSFTAVDGLSLLEGIDFNKTNIQMTPPNISLKSPFIHIRDVLWHNLGSRLPIEFISSVKKEDSNDNAFAGSASWRYDDDYKDFNGNPIKCDFVLTEILKSMAGMTIVQSKGRWIIRRIADILTGNYTAKLNRYESPTILENVIVNTSLPIDFRNNNQIYRVLPAIKSYKTTYENNIAENNLPNGNFEKWNHDKPNFWNNLDNSISFLERVDSISKEGESSVQVSYPQIGDGTTQPNVSIFSLSHSIQQTSSIPIDTEVLYKKMQLGFTFMPVSGFPIDNNVSKFIKWDTKPLNITVSYSYYTENGFRYAILNRFGFWVVQYIGLGSRLVSSFINIGSVGSKSYADIDFKGSPIVNSVFNFNCMYALTGTRLTETFNFSYTATDKEHDNLDLYLDGLSAALPEGFTTTKIPITGGYRLRILFNIGWTNFAWYVAEVADGYNTLDQYGISIEVPAMKHGDVAKVDFNAKQDIKMIPYNGKLAYQLFIKKGQVITFDDVYLKFDDSNDVYECINLDAGKNSKREEEVIKISSAYTGFQKENIMNHFYSSDVDSIFVDEKANKGTLTKLNSITKLKQYSKAKRVIECDMHTINFKATNTYIHDNKKYILISGSLDTADNMLKNANLIQISDNNPNFEIKHYSTNDKQLSN